MSLAKKALFGGLWMSGINYIGFAINFGVQLVLVRLLIPEDFGVFALGLSIAEILFIFFGFAFSMAVIQIQKAVDLFDTALCLSVFLGLGILLIGGIISPILLLFYPLPSVLVFLILCSLQPLRSCASIYSAFMEKELQFKKNAIVRAVATNFSGFVAIFLAFAGFGVWSLIGREIITVTLMFFGMKMASRYRFRRKFNKNTAKRIFEFGYKMLLSRGLEIVYHRVPNFFIGTFAGTTALGLFTQSYYLANLTSTILGALTQNVSFAFNSKIQKDKQKLNQSFYITNYFFIRLLLPIMSILFLFPKQVLSFLYGNKWLDASLMLKYFFIYTAFLPIFSNIISFVYSTGRILDISKAYIFGICPLFIGVFIALYIGKVHIVSLSYSISLIVCLLTTFNSLKRSGINISVKSLFITPILVSSSIIIILSLILRDKNFEVSDITWNLLPSIIVFIICIGIIVILEYKTFAENWKFVWRYLK